MVHLQEVTRYGPKTIMAVSDTGTQLNYLTTLTGTDNALQRFLVTVFHRYCILRRMSTMCTVNLEGILSSLVGAKHPSDAILAGELK